MVNRSVYIFTPDVRSGKSIVSFGIMHLVMRRTTNVGYFKPIIEEKEDSYIKTLISHFNLNMAYEEAFVFTREQVLAYKNSGKTDELYGAFIKHYKQLEARFDFILIEGMNNFDEKTSFEATLNGFLAKSLNIPVLSVFRDIYQTVDALANHVAAENTTLIENNINVIGIFINRTQKDATEIKNAIFEKLGTDIPITVLPAVKALAMPTLREVAAHTEASFLFEGKSLETIAENTLVGAMQLPNFLERMQPNSLIVLPGDRSDLLVGSLLANMSSNYPNVVGYVLSGDLVPEQTIMNILYGFDNMVPIMKVKTGTFETIQKINTIQPKIYLENKTKIKLYLDLFEQHADTEALEANISSFRSETLTPKMFQYQMLNVAKNAQKHIVLPEGSDDRVVTAASQLAKDEIAYITILGNPIDIKERAKKLHLYWNDERIKVINPIESSKYEDYVQTLFELRKDKGMELAQARDLMLDVSYFGTMMVYKGDADGMVSGAMHTTAHTIRPSLQFIKTKPGIQTVSSVFFMLLDDRILVYGDCAVVPNPTAEQLADIAISSAQTARAFGIDPKVAMLSYSSGSSGSGEDVEKVRVAVSIVKDKYPELLAEGPIQYDAAVVPSVGKKKMPNSLVAGHANVLIFPDLNTGNNTYKAVQRESGGLAIGPVLQGLRKPINDLSRGATIPDIYNTIVVTAVQATNS